MWKFFSGLFCSKKEDSFIDKFMSRHKVDTSFDKKEGEVSPIVNILLVYFDQRPSCLLESADYGDRWVVLHKKLRKMIQELGLVETKDPISLKKYPRYFVSKKPISPLPEFDDDIAGLLGMTWTGLYAEYRNPRNAIHINVSNDIGNIFTQVVGGNEPIKPHASYWKKKAKDWEDAWNYHTVNYKLRFKFQLDYDPGTKQRERRLLQNDKQYLEKNTEEYYNDALNFMKNPVKPSKSTMDRYKTMYKKINQKFT